MSLPQEALAQLEHGSRIYDRGVAMIGVRALGSTTTFVGREAELAAAASAVGPRRVVTVAGPGGTGNTRLVAELAQTLVESGSDVWFVELAATSTDRAVAEAIIAALGWREGTPDGADGPLDPVAAALATRRGVLILDNCEHVLAAAAAVTVRVLEHCPDVSVVATSREPLRIGGEAVFRLTPLPAPRAGDQLLLEELAEMASVRVLSDRIRLHDHAFSLSDENQEAVARVCALLDGLPLALELAAPWFRILSPSEVADRIEDNLDFLAAYDSAAPERQRTLAAVLDWSHALLSDEERRLFERLSVFSGGFTLEAAEASCPGGELSEHHVLVLLARLVDASLVVKEERLGVTWYRLLETVREFSRRRLESARAPDTTDDPWAFRRDGELWIISPQPVRLPHAKGLGYIHELLRKAGEELHALDLSGRIRQASTGPVLDDTARAEYRARLADLRAEADEAASHNDLERAARAEEEIDGIVTQLAAAFGLSGRDRTSDSGAERARMSVTKAIRWAIQRVRQHDEAVAAHLDASINTGTYCRYDPAEGVSWVL